MFDYKEFKKEMQQRGHKVNKNGKYIDIEPNNNYIEYRGGFEYIEDIVEGFEKYLKLKSCEHYNKWVYSARFAIKD